MLTLIKQPYKEEDIVKTLNPLVKEWFFSKFKSFSLPQLYGVLEIHNRNNILITASTGSGKTLTAFLSILNELVTLSENNLLEEKVYAVYISPLKALNNDILVNLQNPLKEIKEIAKKYNKELKIKVAVRTGDTTPAEKQKMLKECPHILVTTPESLAIVLAAYKFRERLKDVQYCITDEIHSLAESKRGVHLSLSLERLQYLSPKLTRIGLSATVAPIEEIAKFLVGNERDCKIAEVQFEKKVDLKVISPSENLIDLTYDKMHKDLYNLIDQLIQEHKTTLIFTNTRAATERVVHYLKEKFPKKYLENIGAHHGSLSKKHRFEIEEKLRKGLLKTCVSSTSLELGIDIGYIDLVICLGSPKSVARMLQRTGRSGHKLHDTVKARVIVLDRDDLVECSLLVKNALERKIDKIHIPTNCLDVLAQHIHGMATVDIWKIDDLFKLITSSYCYRDLNKKDFLEVVNYLAGSFSSLEDRHIYAKIWYDEKENKIGKKGKMSRVIHMTNIGTIPDETAVLVKIKDEVIGTIDEAFLERLTPGDIFVLGGNTYQFRYSSGMTAQVAAAEGKKPTVPSWFSEMLPLSFDLAIEIQKFRLYMESLLKNKSKKEILDYINKYLYVDEKAGLAVYNYFNEQFLYAEIPNRRKLLIENFSDKDKNYYIFHFLYGRRVNDVISRALGYALARIEKKDIEIGINDNGFYLASKKALQVSRALELLKPEELEKVMIRAIEGTEILKRRFRHCAARALMILRRYKGKEKRVGRQQVSSMILLSAVKRISENFCILKEARREVLQDLMDLDNATKILKEIKDKEIEIKKINTVIPSPFAFNLVTQAHTDIMKAEERIEFIRRMHYMVLAKIGKNHKID